MFRAARILDAVTLRHSMHRCVPACHLSLQRSEQQHPLAAPQSVASQSHVVVIDIEEAEGYVGFFLRCVSGANLETHRCVPYARFFDNGGR